MRALAMTGMVTAALMALIMEGSDILATPPFLRMSAGTRSRAITATAPASSAMRASSTLVTSCSCAACVGGVGRVCVCGGVRALW
eukprot:scaffold4242_cov20-Tisochrysis_lutea.AAC.7